MQAGCPRCPLTAEIDRLKSRVRAEAIKRFAPRRLYRTWPFDFSMDDAFSIYQLAAGLLAESGDRVLPEWDETEAALAGVVLSERNQARAVDDYNAALAASSKPGGRK